MAKWGYAEAQRSKGQPSSQGRRAARLILGSLVLILGVLLVVPFQNVVGSNQSQYSLVFTQMPLQPERLAKPAGPFHFREIPPKGSRIVLLSAEGTLSVLTPEFFSATDPAVSFDGKRILFSGKRASRDHWDIWEMDVDGKNKKQVTQNFGNCREPKYLATSSISPPDFEDKVRWITFTSDAANTYDELGSDLSTALYARNLEPIQGRGLVTRRSTFNLSSDFSPAVLRDGRILFTSRQEGDSPTHANGRFLLLASNWDGSGLNLFCGTNQGAWLKTMAAEMPDRTLVFVESEGENPDGSGRLARVSFKRPLHSYELLSKAAGRYRNPCPLPDGRMLVSYKSAKEGYGIYFLDIEKGRPGQKVYADPKWESVAAVPVTALPEPTGLISSVVDSESTADLQCLNIYDSSLPEAVNLRKGDVKTVRLVEGVPILKGDKMEAALRKSGALLRRVRILGEAPVEPDGSFLMKLPGDTPFYLQLLNEEGMALVTMPSWIWVRRGTSRGCIGCHEDKELTPENRATDALVKLHNHSLLVPPEQRQTVDFRKTVQPVLQAKCLSCHGGAAPAGKLSLSMAPAGPFNKAYERLLALGTEPSVINAERLVLPGNARQSRLIRVLFGRANNPGMKHPDVLKDDEKQAIAKWIDLGAAWEN